MDSRYRFSSKLTYISNVLIRLFIQMSFGQLAAIFAGLALKKLLHARVPAFVSLFLCLTEFVLADPPNIVYRSVMEDPSEVKRSGGFLPKGADGTRPNQPPVNLSLFNHAIGSSTGLANISSGYVATTSSLTLAHLWVNQNLSGLGYIYFIQPTGNMIDLNNSLGQFAPHPDEMEYAALGIIRWNQIIGWSQVFFGVMQKFVHNSDFNPSLYRFAHAGGDVPELAGFPYDHPAWSMEPWIQFANCNRSKPLKNLVCHPKISAQREGAEYFYRANYEILLLLFSD